MRRLRLPILLVAVVLGLLVSFSSSSAYDFSGDYASAKVVGKTNLILTIGGTASLDVGMAPELTTLSAQDVDMDVGNGTYALLRGNVSDVNGLPTRVWFEWGYGGAFGNTIGTQTVTSAGQVTQVLTGFSPHETVSYRFMGHSDGTTNGGSQVLRVQGFLPGIYSLVSILPYIFVAMILLMMIALYYSGISLIVVLILGAMVALIGLAGVDILLDALQNWW